MCGEPSRTNSDLESLSLSPLLSIHDLISSIHNSSCLMAVETSVLDGGQKFKTSKVKKMHLPFFLCFLHFY